MIKTILVTGAKGFIASHLIPLLRDKYDVKLLTRKPLREDEYIWDLSTGFIDARALEDIDAIVHLAGAKLNDGTPLTKQRKKLIYDTRIGAADLVRKQLIKRKQKIKTFVSASAIGYYGFTDETLEIDEKGQKGFGFIADMCDDWEKAGQRFKTEGVANHTAQIRVSLTLGNNGGIFPIYKNTIAESPRIEDLPNYSSMSWNHVTDMAQIFAFAVERELDGVYNSVAPEAASPGDLLKAIANQTSNANYKILPFKGRHLVAKKIINEGYRFRFSNIESAVKDLIRIYKTS